MIGVIRVIPAFVLVFALAGLVLGIYEWLSPPFTDEQIRDSTLHTWEVARSTMRVFGIVFLGLGLVCLALARRGEGFARVLGQMAAAACLITLVVFLRNHVALTQRAAQLTGQDFGPLFGLL